MDLSKATAEASHVEAVPQAADRELVAAILRRDRKATAEFVARYTDDIYLYVRSRLAPRVDLVDDLVQEVFLAAWESLGAYRGDASLRSWLQGIARHKIENYYRACLRAPLPFDDAGPEIAGAIADIGVDESLDRGRLEEKTRRILATLPETHSLALLWRYWEKRSAQEMAERTGKTVKAVERLLARARHMFRERWKDE
ncbi:MAG TPA: RNA polymerase sigma factor [Bryobacteraceae bacterium]|nr:RNA polymerase sigma factor [Bryobacteraceae bacterium]